MFIELHFGHFDHKLPKFTIRQLEGVFCELALPLVITLSQSATIRHRPAVLKGLCVIYQRVVNQKLTIALFQYFFHLRTQKYQFELDKYKKWL